MADFLSEDWFAGVNANLGAAGPVPLEGAATIRVVLEFTDAPGSAPHALTFTLASEGASVAVGDHLAANALVKLTYRDARRLVDGEVTSADTLREGRIKVRGDLDSVVTLVEWLKRAHPHAEA